MEHRMAATLPLLQCGPGRPALPLRPRQPARPAPGLLGECGKPLERKWGAGFSVKPHLLALGVLMVTLLLSFAVTHIGQADAPVVTLLIVLVIIILGFRLAFRILPPWVGKFVGDTMNFFM